MQYRQQVEQQELSIPKKNPETTYIAPDIEMFVESVEGFWKENFPTLNAGQYSELGVGFVYRSDDPKRPGWCGDMRVTQEDAEQNAFYCFVDDYVMYDPALMEYLARDVGAIAPAIVIAHEWGHRIQNVANNTPSVGLLAELQADCYAGAWLAGSLQKNDVPAGETPKRAAVIASLLIADVESYAGAEDAHGTAFDRIRAMRHGVDTGVGGCQRYASDPGNLIQGTTFGGGGFDDVPYEQIPAVAAAVINKIINTSYQTSDAAADRCLEDNGGERAWRCEGEEKVGYSDRDLLELYEKIGDSAAMVPLYRAYLEIAGKTDKRQQDCLIGAALGEQYQNYIDVPGIGEITLAGKDLDEVIEFMLNETLDDEVYDKVGALQTGFEKGARSC